MLKTHEHDDDERWLRVLRVEWRGLDLLLEQTSERSKEVGHAQGTEGFGLAAAPLCRRDAWGRDAYVEAAARLVLLINVGHGFFGDTENSASEHDGSKRKQVGGSNLREYA